MRKWVMGSAEAKFSQDTLANVDTRDLLKVCITGQEDGVDRDCAGGDVNVLQRKDLAFPVELPGKIESLLPNLRAGIDIAHACPCILIAS